MARCHEAKFGLHMSLDLYSFLLCWMTPQFLTEIFLCRLAGFTGMKGDIKL